MAYNDVPHLSYKVLEKMRAARVPFRGTEVDAWPIGDRDYSDRHFRYDKNTGVYDLYLGHLKTVDRLVAGHINDATYDRDMSVLNACHLGRMHPDNTFEFLAPRSGGNFMFLESAFDMNFFTQKNIGGAATSWRGPGYEMNMHPLFHGLRVNMDTKEVHPSTHYTTLHPTLKIKESKEYMKRFDEFLSVYHMFLDPIEGNGIAEIFEDLKDKGYDKDMHTSTLIESLVLQRHYADAAVMCGAFIGLWAFRNPKQMHNYIKKCARHVLTKKNLFAHHMLYNKPELFKYYPIPMGARLSTTKWNIRIESHGKDMCRL